MWIALVIMIGFPLLMALPVSRAAVTWVVQVVVVPWVVFRKIRVRPRPVYEACTLEDGRVPVPARHLLGQNGALLEGLGFVDRGVWIAVKGDGVTTTVIRVLSHEASFTVAILASNPMGLAMSLVTIGAGRTITTSDAGRPTMGRATDSDTWLLPALRSPRLLWAAHRVHIAERKPPEFDAMPEGLAAWSEYVETRRERELETYIKAGLFKRGKSAVRPTLWGTLVMSKRELWPWKNREARRTFEMQMPIFKKPGMLELLREGVDEAKGVVAQHAPVRGAAEGLLLADDHGRRVPTARMTQADGDERTGDPRFRALLAQADSARRRQYFTGGALPFIISTLGAIVLAVYFQLPVWVVAVVVFFAVMVRSTLGNIGRIAVAEEAARAVLISRGLCAACLYSLKGIEKDGGGCLTCPECSAAWKADRVRTFTVFSTAGQDDLWRMRRTLGAVGTTNSNRTAIKDHRGASSTLADPRLKGEIYVATRDMRTQLRRAAAVNGKNGRWTRWIFAIICALLFIVLPVGALIYGGRPGRMGPSMIFLLLPWVMGGLLIVGILRGNFGFRKKKVIGAMLAENLCPSCVQDISARPIEGDGCKVCVCGAAWRVSPRMGG